MDGAVVEGGNLEGNTKRPQSHLNQGFWALLAANNKKVEHVNAALAACSSKKVEHVNVTFTTCFARITNPVLEEGVEIACHKDGIAPERSKPNLVKHHVWMLWTKEESSKKCVLPTAFAPCHFTLQLRDTSYPNVSLPLRYCVCPNSKQAQGPLRSHNILPPKNP